MLAFAAVALSACENRDEPTPSLTPIGSSTATPSAAPTFTPAPTLASTQPATPTPVPPPSGPGETLSYSNELEPPRADIYDLARRLLPSRDHTPPPSPEIDAIGDVRSFYAVNPTDLSTTTVWGELCASTEHADFYVDITLLMSCEVFEGAGTLFENDIYPRGVAYFAPTPLQETMPRIALLHGTFSGFGWTFRASDLLPGSIDPSSNERPVLYLNIVAYGVGGHPASAGYNQLVAHELQHLVQYLADPHEAKWIDEGLAELSESAFGDRYEFADFINRCGPTQLASWPATNSSGGSCHYSGAGLFMSFLLRNYPDGDNSLKRFVADTNSGLSGIDSYLHSAGYDTDAVSVFAEWGAANYLHGRSHTYLYADLSAIAPPTFDLPANGIFSEPLTQFAPTYVDLGLNEAIHHIDFQGEGLTPLTRFIDEGEGCFWHAGRTDSADFTLTRPFDLRTVAPEDAALTLLLRYDIENSRDFVYILASTDLGETWSFLESPGMVDALASTVRQFGPALTGESGGNFPSVWATEEVNLGRFAGQEILIRLEYVTDRGMSFDGVSVAGAWLPALDYEWVSHDGAGLAGIPPRSAAEDRGGWFPDGFFFSNNRVEQDYVVRLLTVSQSGGASVTPIDLNDSGYGDIFLDNTDGSVREAAIMIFPAAPWTKHRAQATLTVTAA